MVDEHSAVKSLYHKVRLYSMFVIGLLAVVVILQNMDQVATKVLFWNFEMPRAALLLATLLAGFAGGVMWAGFRRRK